MARGQAKRHGKGPKSKRRKPRQALSPPTVASAIGTQASQSPSSVPKADMAWEYLIAPLRVRLSARARWAAAGLCPAILLYLIALLIDSVSVAFLAVSLPYLPMTMAAALFPDVLPPTAVAPVPTPMPVPVPDYRGADAGCPLNMDIWRCPLCACFACYI